VRSRAARWRRSAACSCRRARKEHMAIEGGLMALTGARRPGPSVAAQLEPQMETENQGCICAFNPSPWNKDAYEVGYEKVIN
jgi:hypothetical protein